MTDTIDRAVQSAQGSSEPPQPAAVRFEFPLGPGRVAIVILPAPITELDLFNVNARLGKWYLETFEAEHPANGLVVPTGPLPNGSLRA